MLINLADSMHGAAECNWWNGWCSISLTQLVIILTQSKVANSEIEKKCCSLCATISFIYGNDWKFIYKTETDARTTLASCTLQSQRHINPNEFYIYMYVRIYAFPCILSFAFGCRVLFAFECVLFKHICAATARAPLVENVRHISANSIRNRSPKCICVAESCILFDLKT